MRKSYVALLLLVGAAAALASTALARTDEFGADNTPAKMINAQLNSEMRSAVARPGVAGGNDTVYIGFRPGKVSATNYWASARATLGRGLRTPPITATGPGTTTATPFPSATTWSVLTTSPKSTATRCSAGGPGATS